jgi:RNA-directed DNA polymerase
LKETKKVKHYFRYCDDLVILSDSKEELHLLLTEIVEYLSVNLKLTVKSNYQIFPINNRGIDFVGYKSYHTHILLRKGIKKRFVQMIKHNSNSKSIGSYWGWISHSNGINLWNKYVVK